jgi:hypothetical protein
MSFNWFLRQLPVAAASLLLSGLLNGCVSNACPGGQKLENGKCVDEDGADEHGGADAGNIDTDAGLDVAAASDAGDAAGGASAVETPDGGSAGCAGQVLSCWQDRDHDGYAASDAASMNVGCERECPTGWTAREPIDDDVDCKESDAKVRPRHCWRDADMDGFAGDTKAQSVFCVKRCPVNWTATEPKEDAIDCRDDSAQVNPKAGDACNGNDDDCDGTSDENGDELCDLDNATSKCTQGACAITACETGFGDCDDSAETGCEQKLDAVLHCGDCLSVCDPLASCEPTQTKNVGDCVCPPPSFGDGLVCHGLGPIAAGWRATCVLGPEGASSCWGAGSTATAIPGDGVWRQLSIGPTVGCGILEDYRLQCWGTTIVPGDAKFIQVVVGTYYACALRTDHTTTCWGFGDNPGSYGETSAPNEKFVQLSGGSYHVCGLREDGKAFCWGAGSFDRTQDCQSTGYDCGQAQPPLDGRFVQIAAGLVHTCALKADGSVQCWGAGVTSGTEASALKYDQAVPPSGEFSWIAAGAVHNCGIHKSDGTAECWGAGQADGMKTYDYGQSVPPDDSFLVLSAGLYATCGLTAKYHGVVCWGSASEGAPTEVMGKWPLNPLVP